MSKWLQTLEIAMVTHFEKVVTNLRNWFKLYENVVTMFQKEVTFFFFF